METGITWNIDTLQYTDKQLRRLSSMICEYDSSISRDIDDVLENRKLSEMEEKRIKEETRRNNEMLVSEINRDSQPRGRKAKWTPELITEEAAKFESRTDFSKKSSGAYSAAKGLGILDQLFPTKVRGI